MTQQVSVTIVPIIAVTYAVDCYKPIAGEIMAVATVLKNTGGFAMSYWLPPLAAREGLFSPTMVEFALTHRTDTVGGAVIFLWKEAEEADKKFCCTSV